MQRRTLLSAVAAAPLATFMLPSGGAEAAPPPKPPKPPKPDKLGYVAGKVAPDLSLLTATGATLRLSDLRGKYVVLNFSTMWCGFSQQNARDVRDFVDSVNAPKALKAPLVWVSAEFDGFEELVAPTPGQLVRFGLTELLGDPTTPLARFGAFGEAGYAAGQDQLTNYATANGGTPGFPAFVVLDPKGVVLAVLQGYDRDTTLTQIRTALRARTVPFKPTAPPYKAAVLGSVQVTATVDGSTGSATAHPALTLDDLADLGNGYSVAVFSEASRDCLYDVVRIGFGAADNSSPLSLDSTFELGFGDVVWQDTGEFESLAAVPAGFSLVLNVAQTANPEIGDEVRTPVVVDADGHVGPFLLRDVVEASQEAIDGLNLGPVTVYGVSLVATFDGPVVSTYGQ
jgi:hypothetical protein